VSSSDEEEISDVCQFTRELKVKNVLYSALPVEYPPTTDEGVAIVFSLEKTSNEAIALQAKAAEFFRDVRFHLEYFYFLKDH
jgi:hypothetical protein